MHTHTHDNNTLPSIETIDFFFEKKIHLVAPYRATNFSHASSRVVLDTTREIHRHLLISLENSPHHNRLPTLIIHQARETIERLLVYSTGQPRPWRSIHKAGFKPATGRNTKQREEVVEKKNRKYGSESTRDKKDVLLEGYSTSVGVFAKGAK